MITELEFKSLAQQGYNRIPLMAEAFAVDERLLQVSPSIGIALYPDDGIDSNGLLKSADSLMYLAKQSGKGQYRFSR